MSASLQDPAGFGLAPVVWLGSRKEPKASLTAYLQGRPEIGFKATVLPGGGLTAVLLEGELDMATVPEFESALAAVDVTATVVVDLSSLKFLDCSALHSFLSARSRFQDAGGVLKLVPGPPHIQRLFTLTRVDALFEFVKQTAASV